MTATLTDTIAPLVDELSQVLAAKTDLEQRERDLKARIREAVPGPDAYQAGDRTLVITANNRFDAKKAIDLIPDEARTLVTHTETIVDRDKVRALLPDVFEQAQTYGDYRVSIR